MSYTATARHRWSRDRLIGAAAAVAVQALLGYALLAGLTVRLPAAIEDGLKLFVAGEPPRPPRARVIAAPRVATARREGRAAPPNLRSRATALAAPEPIVVVPLPPPPLVTAPKPYVADEATSGSAMVRGPGTGAGGTGDGFGSGGDADGNGSGTRPETAPRLLRGKMSTSDLPDKLFVTGFQGTVGVRYLVARTGQVTACTVTRSSGSAQVDAATCRLIRERFRFRPSLDGAGHPVDALIVENHSWEVEADTLEER